MESIHTIVSSVLVLMLTGIGTVGWYFVRRIIDKIDHLVDSDTQAVRAQNNIKLEIENLKRTVAVDLASIPKLANGLRGINSRLDHFEKQLETALIAAAKVEALREEIGAMKKENSTQWKHIDKCKLDIETIQATVEGFSDMIAEFRQSIEQIHDLRSKSNGR